MADKKQESASSNTTGNGSLGRKDDDDDDKKSGNSNSPPKDPLAGSDKNDHIEGTSGNDRIFGLAGNDQIDGKDGNDHIEGGTGNDKIDGGNGDDYILGGDGNDNINGGAGNDYIEGGIGNDNLDGGKGNDVMLGGADNDNLNGEEGNDTLDGGDGNDELKGEDGNDVLLGGAGKDKLKGGKGNDVLRGGLDKDEIDGDDGDDEIIWKAGDGEDKIDGGKGNDTFTLITSDNVAQVVRLSARKNGDLVVMIEGSEGAELDLKDIENFKLVMGRAGATLELGDLPAGALGNVPVALTGGNEGGVIDASKSNVPVKITAGSGDNTLTGGNASDQISGGSGRDVISGGKGDDSINAGVGDDKVVWKAGDGNDVIDGGDGFDAVDLTLDQAQASSLTISADADGNVILVNSDGSRLKLNGVEDVVINAGAAGSTITIGDLTGTDIAQDTLYFVGGAGSDGLNASATDRRIHALGNGGDDLLRSGSGNDFLSGGDGNDTLDAGGGSGVDTVLGGAGNDRITATLGDEQNSLAIDIIDGGTGSDSLNVIFVEPTPHDLILRVRSNGDGSFNITSEDININETVRVTNVENLKITAGEGALRFYLGALSATTLVQNGVEFAGSIDADFFDGGATDVKLNLHGNGGADTLVGGSRDDYLHGGAGNDSLSGSGGNDNLVGDTGDDLLDGGQGFDTADYSGASSGVSVNLNLFTAQNTVGAGNDTLVNIERVLGSSFADTLVANNVGSTLVGGAGNDHLTGAGGFDILRGGAGNDTLIDTVNGLLSGDAGNDSIDGTAHYENDSNGVVVNYSNQAVDVYGNGSLMVAARTAVDGYGDIDSFGTAAINLHASNFADHVTGSDDNQYFFLRAGNDKVFGLGGNDTFHSGSGNDIVDGGSGSDIVNYQDDGYDGGGPATQGINANLATGIIIDGWGHTDTVSNVEGIIGSEMNDTLVGDANANSLFARGGNDIVYGGGGNDTLAGWSGNDFLYGEDGNDVLIGDADNDTMSGGSGADTYVFSTFSVPGAAFGHDTITDFDTAADRLDLAQFNISSMAGVQAIATDNGTHTTITIDANRTILLQNVRLNQLSTTNFIFAQSQAPGINGTAGNDNLIGTAGNDSIYGLAGNDRLEGLAGNDLLDGGDGNDQVIYQNDPAGVTVNLALGTATDGHGNTDTLVSIESIQGSVFADTLIGNAGDNTIFGDFGTTGAADIISGGAGNDSIIGGPGIDIMDGGAGRDVVYFSQEGINFGQVGLTVTFAADGSVTMYNPHNGQTEISQNFEGVVGSLGADTITGNAQDNFIQGFYGNNLLDGGAGNDTVFFSLGNPVTVDLAAGSAFRHGFTQLGTDTLLNFENVIGNPGNDRLYGDSQNNILEGINGNDVLRGGAGNDVLNGGVSTLLPYFGNPDTALDGFDTADYSTDPASVTVNLATGTATDGWGGNDTLISINGVIGSNYADTLIGDATNNTLEGLGGNDTLTGGAGADTFVLRDDANGIAIIGLDTITDFNVTADKFDLRAFSDLNSRAQLNISQDGADTLITFDANNVVRLSGVTATALTNANFQFAVPVLLNGTEGNDTLNGAEGNDRINGLGGNDQLYGHDGNDFIDGGPGSDNIYGGAGNDTLNGGTGYDNIWGEAGNDIINTNNGTARGGTGNDTITGTNILWDDLWGEQGDDILSDPDGSGFVRGGPGNDSLDGMPSYENDPAGVVVNMDNNAWDVHGNGSLVVQARTARDAYGDSDTLLAGARNLHASHYNDYVKGSAFSQYMMLRAGNDTAFGMDGDDNFLPGSGDDYIDGGNGFDQIDFFDDGYNGLGLTATQGVVVNLGTVDHAYNYNGVSGTARANSAVDGFGDDDTIYNVESVRGSVLNDVIVGSAGHNWLWGNAGDDQIYGMGDNDNLIGYSGNDFLDGGDGNGDTAWYQHAGQTSGIHVNLANGTTYNDGFGHTDTLVSIENVEGSRLDDLIIGDSKNNRLIGNEGNDVLHGGDGDDQFEDRQGNDQVFGEAGNDRIHASAGNDLLDGGSGRDSVTYQGFTGTTAGITLDMTAVVNAGGYTNVVVVSNDGFGTTDYLRSIEDIQGTDYNDSITGDANDNNFSGGAGNDTLFGGDGNDFMRGDDDFDVLHGGNGNDYLDGGENDDILTGGAGFDTFAFTRFTNQGNLTSFGQDVITDFSLSQDRLDLWNVPEMSSLQALQSYATQDGNDVLISFPSTFNGITETNSIRLQNLTLANLPNMNITFSPINGTSSNDVLNSGPFGEHLRGLEGNDILNGNDGNDRLEGGPGNDSLFGGNGFDNLIGGPGNDLLDGGADSDFAVYRWSGELTGVNVNLATGTATNDGFGGVDTLTNVENVEGSQFADTIVGDAQNNFLRGHEGNDLIQGGAGHDNLQGDAGDDALYGEDGNDYIDGADGNDIINGGAGNDSIVGGRGADTIDGGADWDHIGFPAHVGITHGVQVNLGLNSVIDDGTGSSDTVVNVEAVSGTQFNDVITGDALNNYLQGLGGNDTLKGGGGNDTLVGGAGNDLFLLSDGGNITIPDFMTGAGSEDVIDLQGVSSLTDFAGTIAAASNDGFGNTNISLGGGFNLHLVGVSVANLHPDDFTF